MTWDTSDAKEPEQQQDGDRLIREIIDLQDGLVTLAEMVRAVYDRVDAARPSGPTQETGSPTALLDLQAGVARIATTVDDMQRELRTPAGADTPSTSEGSTLGKTPVLVGLGMFACLAVGIWYGTKPGSDPSAGWAAKIWSDNRSPLASCVNEAISRRAEITCQVAIRP